MLEGAWLAATVEAMEKGKKVGCKLGGFRPAGCMGAQRVDKGMVVAVVAEDVGPTAVLNLHLKKMCSFPCNREKNNKREVTNVFKKNKSL